MMILGGPRRICDEKAAGLFLCFHGFLQIHHAHEHGAAWIKGQVLESPSRIEAAHAVIERVRDDTHAAHDFGRVHSGFEREKQQR